MTRIEAALARIEAAGSSRPAASADADKFLRAKVGNALKELDALIAELES